MARGELKKFHLGGGRCKECRKVYLSDSQAATAGVSSGWYESLITARAAIEGGPYNIDPAIRVNKDRYCPDCPNKPQ